MQDRLDRLIPEPLSYLKGTFRFDAGGSETIDCRALCAPEQFEAVIDRYAARFPGADRRAAVSVWTMYYFSHLVVSPLIFWLLDRRILALGAADLVARLDPQTILPAGFILRDEGGQQPEGSVFDAMDGATRNHAQPLIATIAAQSGLSPKLLWSNVAVYADWVIREVGAAVSERRDEALALIENARWADGSPNPMSGWIRQEIGADGACFSQRRICCLRYLLPGVPGCGMVCPIPAGRE